MTLIRQQAPVIVGVSGGKDSVACALEVEDLLRAARHTGPRLLIHADLGEVEWEDSYPSCERLAKHIGWEIQTVRRQAGGMMARWEARWANSIHRYENLECVRLILPWSTPSMRFCTAELKRDPIFSYIRKRFGKTPVLSVTGIRAQESAVRAKMPPSREQPRLHPGSLDWNPILRWPVEAVFERIKESGLPLHEAYTLFGSSRVSCAFCIMSRKDDLVAALKDPRNRKIYERMCHLELDSAFAFQSNFWLTELDPLRSLELLWAKTKAASRAEYERAIPKHLEFTKGWPEVMPTEEEAATLARVRKAVSMAYGFNSQYLTGATVMERYADLMAAKQQKEAKRK